MLRLTQQIVILESSSISHILLYDTWIYVNSSFIIIQHTEEFFIKISRYNTIRTLLQSGHHLEYKTTAEMRTSHQSGYFSYLVCPL